MGKKISGLDFLKKKNFGFLDDSNPEFYRYSDGSGSYSDSSGNSTNVESDGSGYYNGADGSYGRIDSDGSGYYNGSDGSYGSRYSDGSGYYNDADGSYGSRYSDGSGYYNGADGSYGSRYSDGSGYFTDAKGNTTYFDKDDDDDSNDYASDNNEDHFVYTGNAVIDFLSMLFDSTSEDEDDDEDDDDDDDEYDDDDDDDDDDEDDYDDDEDESEEEVESSENEGNGNEDKNDEETGRTNYQSSPEYSASNSSADSGSSSTPVLKTPFRVGFVRFLLILGLVCLDCQLFVFSLSSIMWDYPIIEHFLFWGNIALAWTIFSFWWKTSNKYISDLASLMKLLIPILLGNLLRLAGFVLSFDLPDIPFSGRLFILIGSFFGGGYIIKHMEL